MNRRIMIKRDERTLELKIKLAYLEIHDLTFEDYDWKDFIRENSEDYLEYREWYLTCYQNVTNELLQGDNVLRVEQLIQERQPALRRRCIRVILDGESAADNLILSCGEPPVQEEGAVGQVDRSCFQFLECLCPGLYRFYFWTT